jgi:hypothetical protein
MSEKQMLGYGTILGCWWGGTVREVGGEVRYCGRISVREKNYPTALSYKEVRRMSAKRRPAQKPGLVHHTYNPSTLEAEA